MNGKARRVKQKLDFSRTFAQDAGCARCGYNANAVALIFTEVKTSPVKLSYDDYGWQAIRRAASKARVVCLNCKEIEKHEMLKARYA